MATPPPGTPNDSDAERKTRTANEESAPDALLDGKYRVERVIGEGAFGRVFLATDTRLRRAVAIKELLAARNATEPVVFQRYLERFSREARAGGAISHPNVVTVYEMEIDHFQNTYLVMEYVDGMDLGTLLEQVGTLPAERAVAITLDIARALDAVHEADIVHRDLKPANIMISRRGGAKLADFGIAQVGTESQRTQVVVGHPGTPLYMSPEQATGYGYIDGRSDLYSLGLVLYEMLVGEPYARRRIPLGQAKPDTPPALVAIVEKLIQKAPEQRYQSAAELITALSQVFATAPTTAPGGYDLPPAPTIGYVPGPPSQVTNYPAAPGVPSAYGGPPSQGAYGAPGPTGQYPIAPQTQSGTRYAPPGGAPPSPYGAPPYQPPYQPPPSIPPQKRGGIPPMAIVGIVAAVLIVVIGGIILAAMRGGGGNPATATVGAGTTVAGGTTATATTTAASATATTVASTTPSTNQTPSARPSGTPASRTSTPVGTAARPVSTAPSGTALAGVGTMRAGAGTAFPTASNQVKLTPGKPLPTAAGPNIYVNAENRYTLQYPNEWQQEPGDTDTDVQFSLQGTTLAGVTSTDLNGDPKPSAQQLADQVYGTFSKQLTNFKTTDTTQVKVANQDGVRMLYTFTDKNNTVTLGGYLVAFSTEDTIILFSGYASQDTFNARIPTYDSVAGSFTGGIPLDNTYTDPQGRFSFDYPAGWSEQKSNSSAVAVLVAPSAGTPSFNVVTATTSITLQQFYDANVKTIADPSTGFKAYKKVSESDTTIANQPAKLQVYTADLGSGTIFELHQWYIVAGGKGYVLTYSVRADKARDFGGTGPIIANSFTLT